MKNIFLLPTEKPSRLFIDVDNNKLTITENPIGGKHFMNQNLYITSNEEIKVDEYYLGEDNNIYCLVSTVNYNGKKIILTTDVDLIKDGVQKIENEFLQWFINNSNCESIKVEGHIYKGQDKTEYKIIIPKQEWVSPMRPFKVRGEAKQKDCCTPSSQIKRYKNCVGCDKKPKQETLEEGAKWKVESSYSEEEVLDLLNIYKIISGAREYVNSFYEEFKKK